MNMISAETSLVGVIGDPISHSLSPTIHNAALREMNLNWSYMAIPCKSNNLELVISALSHIDCKGLNITIPHKNNSIRHCIKISKLAKEIGAVNTLIPHKEGGWLGDNTDVEGFISPIKDVKNWEEDQALVIGCGGSAKAVVAGLKRLNLNKITIISRSQDSLKNFIVSVSKNNPAGINIEGFLSKDSQVIELIKEASLIINTTPVGMKSRILDFKEDNQVPLGREVWENLKPEAILYDLIYNPKPTEWLKIGLEKKCTIINGLEMLVQQGAASLKLWTGIEDIPIELMRKAAENSLN